MAGRFALIVAADQYEDAKFRKLRAPTQDAAALSAVLQDPDIGGFSVNIRMNRPAQEISEEIERFFKHRSPEDLLLLYFSCHGLKDQTGRLYFASTNTKLALPASTAVSSQFVNEQLERSRSRRIVLMLDCCYSGAFSRGFAPRGEIIGESRVGVRESFFGHGRVIITASDALEYAFEDEELTSETARPAIFTDAVVRGLRSGDADLDRDGRVSVDDLYGYVYEQVRARTPHQTPTKTSTVQGGLYIAANPLQPTTPITGSTDPFRERTSKWGWQREEAALGLRKLTESADEAMATAATKALEQLTADQDRLVRASAMAALGDVTQSHYERGLVLDRQGDVEGALLEFKEVLTSEQTNLGPLAAFNLGVLSNRVGRIDEAERYYRLAIDSRHSRAAASAAFNLGCMLEAKGSTKAAESAYETALTFGDANVQPRAAFLLGQLREEQSNYSTAWRAYSVARMYDNHPYVAEAESRYEALAQYATGRDLIVSLLHSAGFSDAEVTQLLEIEAERR
jgi:uncharacterized caspase-like protein